MLKTALGLMSGTSMDGIDVALVRTDGASQVDFGPTFSLPFDLQTRNEIEAALEIARAVESRTDRPAPLDEVERLITRLHVQAVEEFMRQHSVTRDAIDVLGFHGQTVFHAPERALTVQLGQGDVLANATGINVVADMRAADMEAGGQGAPLVPVFHQVLAAQSGVNLPAAFVNIGGIANITYVGRDGELIAFDTGPGNALIDQWVQLKASIPFDQGGRIASEGRIVPAVKEHYLGSDYLQKPYPKSLDRMDFPPLDQTSIELSDGARTLARVTAETIVMSADVLPEFPACWVICGGGRLNDTIMADLRALTSAQGGNVVNSDTLGLDGDMMEAQAFGYLAVRSVRNLPLTFPTTTGCRAPATGGVFHKADVPV